MDSELLANLDKIHTTEMGAERIRRNLGIEIADIISWSIRKIEGSRNIIRKGKNWYVYIDDFVLTVNAHSFTLITAHPIKA